MKNCSFPKWPGFGRARLVLGLSFQTERVKVWSPESVPLAQRMLESSCVLEFKSAPVPERPIQHQPKPYTVTLLQKEWQHWAIATRAPLCCLKPRPCVRHMRRRTGFWKFWIQGLPKGFWAFKRTGTLDSQGLALAKKACNWLSEPTSSIEMDERCLQIAYSLEQM